jgi:hypothetical protein
VVTKIVNNKPSSRPDQRGRRPVFAVRLVLVLLIVVAIIPSATGKSQTRGFQMYGLGQGIPRV